MTRKTNDGLLRSKERIKSTLVRNLFLAIGLTLIIVFFMKCKNTNAFNQKLPEEFAKYQSINGSNTIKAKNVQMSLVAESIEEIQSFQTAENDVIVYATPSKTENTFYKISPDGVISDSLQLNGKPAHIAFVKGFIIDKANKQYYRWSFNGSKQAIDIVAQNEQLDWDDEKQQHQLAEITKKSPLVYVDYRVDTPTPQKVKEGEIPTLQAMKDYAVLIYFLGDSCFEFSTRLDVGEKFSYPYSSKLLLNNVFKHVNTRVLGDKEITKSPFIKYRYFQMLKQEKVYFSGIGGNTDGYYKLIYHGNLYTDVTFKNDTLRLKELMYLDNRGQSSDIQIDGKDVGILTREKAKPASRIESYMYYTSSALDYALFSNDEKKMYIIK